MSNVTDISKARKQTGQIAVQGKQYEVLHCLKIPLENEVALLPNAAVAEVISYTPLESAHDAPDWFLGHINWRDRRVPIISLEIASGRTASKSEGGRIAVLNTLNSNPKVPYIAVKLQGIPSLTLLRPGSLEWEQTDERPSVIGSVYVDSELAMIPDIDALEQRLEKLHF